MLRIFSRSKLSRREAINYLKKLSLLLSSGATLSFALDAASTSPYLTLMADKIRSGSTVSSVLERDVFPSAAISAIAVSEASGTLALGLSRAYKFMGEQDSFRKKLISSLVYPCFVLALCFVSLLILITVLLPSFSGIFSSLNVPMPALSRWVIAVGRYFHLIASATALLMFAAYRYLSGDKGLFVPLIGAFRKKVLLLSFYSSMSESIASGMGAYDALKISSCISGSAHFDGKLAIAQREVADGDPLSAALGRTGMFDETSVSLLSAAEKSSSLEKVFSQLSALYDEEIQNGIKTFSSLVEPISTLATGLVVGIIVFAMFMPIIKLISVLGG